MNEGMIRLTENDGPPLPEEEMIRLTDLWRRQSESVSRVKKIWRDLEDIHGWTDRGRASWR